jgi:hypothetical protein
MCAAAPVFGAMHTVERDTDASREGTAAHDWAETVLCHRLWSHKLPDTNGHILSNGVALTDDIIENTQHYTNYCMTRHKAFTGVESRVDVHQIHPTDCYGICDFTTYDPQTRTLYVVDYKHGFVPVYADHNWQLVGYAVGCINRLQSESAHAGGEPVIIDRIVCVIIQPRAYSKQTPVVDEWETTPDYIMQTMLPRLVHAARQHEATPHMCCTGSWCHNCNGILYCDAHREATTRAIDVSLNGVGDSPSSESLGSEYTLLCRAEELIKQRKDSVSSHIDAQIRKGERIPSVSLTRGRSSWGWVDQQEVIAIGEMIGVPMTKPKMLTVNQAELALQEKGIDCCDIRQYAVKREGALKLTIDSPNMAHRAFGDS